MFDFRPRAGLNLDSFSGQLESMGTSIHVLPVNDTVRVHIHLAKEDRRKPIEYAETLGTVIKLNMVKLVDHMEQQAAAA